MCRDELQQGYPTGSLGEDDLERAAGGSKTLCETVGSCGNGRQGAICDGELFIEARGVFGGVSHRWRGVVGSGGGLQRVIWSATNSYGSQVIAPTHIACPVLAARSHGRGSCTAVGAH